MAWIFLDWAASGFSTISITLLVAYFNKIVFATGGWGVPGGVLWAWTLAATMFLSAVVSPFLSAWVDRRHIHQRAVVLSSIAWCNGMHYSCSITRGHHRLESSFRSLSQRCRSIWRQFSQRVCFPKLAQGRAADTLSSIGFRCWIRRWGNCPHSRHKFDCSTRILWAYSGLEHYEARSQSWVSGGWCFHYLPRVSG